MLRITLNMNANVSAFIHRIKYSHFPWAWKLIFHLAISAIQIAGNSVTQIG
jgi:hypothetical protein